MIREILINNKWALTEYGITLDDGAISSLMTPPPMKEYITNSSHLEHGERIVRSGNLVVNPRFDARDVNLQIHLEADTREEFLARYNKFCKEVLSKGSIHLSHRYDPDVEYKFLYQACNQYQQWCFGVAKFILKLHEYNPADRQIDININSAIWKMI